MNNIILRFVLISYYNMSNFKYCVWFIPEDQHEWYNYTNSFTPHLTIKSKIDKSKINEIKEFINMIKDYKIKVELVGKLYQTCENHFYALQYNVKPLNVDKLKWWPINAHISFRYKYNIPYTEDEIEEIDKQIKVKEGYLDKIRIYYCNGDFSSWKEIDK